MSFSITNPFLHSLYCSLPTISSHTQKGWSMLPLPPSTLAGMRFRRNRCAGCAKPFDRRNPAIHCCEFRETGFPWRYQESSQAAWARPCGVSYHATCVRGGEPFRTRLSDSNSLLCCCTKPPCSILYARLVKSAKNSVENSSAIRTTEHSLCWKGCERSTP
jgi:hypothetical protein